MGSYILVGPDVRDKQWWNELILACAVIGEPFEVHCWQDERRETKQIMSYGMEKKGAWQGGFVITGKITREFLQFLTRLPKPEDTLSYNKMTPFFTVRFGDRLSSEHYGTELILSAVPRERQHAVDRILDELESRGTVHRNLGRL